MELQASQTNSGFQRRQQFNPNDARYKNCCQCNVKSFTIGFAIIEIFVTCFLVVAIVPDLNTKICVRHHARPQQVAVNQTSDASSGPSSNSTDTSSSSTAPSLSAALDNFFSGQPSDQNNTLGGQQQPNSVNRGLTLIHRMTCFVNMGWLVLAIIHIVAANLMFYGMKSQRWTLFIPHLFTRTLCLALCTSFLTLLVAACIDPLPPTVHVGTLISTAVFLAATSLWILYLIKCQIRCCEFVRRSAETGFSFSNTQRIGPPTMSQQSDSTRAHVSRQGRVKRQTTPSAPYVDRGNEVASEGAEEPRSNGGDASPRVEVRSEDAVATFKIVQPTSLPPLRHTYK